ncbi:hypothetical protein FDG2_2075 [Candidatus Protofrankia californiensis]|uniref:HTH luxR-type domain-containing protein n=1 Tax=Candidatus Protofrankia californiensis TaxID=1839754 RepID=A0A1C3NWX4_9ACTN|nr:hypothetical protein FDG2_2075 [Candidatus Protofrankia californiensis]
MNAERSRIERRLEVDAGEEWTATGAPLPKSMLADVQDVVTTVADLLSPEDIPDLRHSADFHAASAALASVSERLAHLLSGDGELVQQQIRGLHPFVDALVKTQAVRSAVEQARNTACIAAFNDVRDALRQLQSIRSVEQLVHKAAEAICTLGFDRSQIAWAEDGYWITERIFGTQEQAWLDELAEVGRADPQVLHSELYESELIRRRRPLLVSHARPDSPHVHRTFIKLGRVRSYVAAPLMTEGTVAGFIHADRYFQRCNVDEVDREILATFADGFGYLLQRTVLRERIEGLRTRLTTLTESMVRSDVGVLQDGATAGSSGLNWRPTLLAVGSVKLERLPKANLASTLTDREQDIIDLMAKGATNAEIARRLVISEGTAKWHVKNVLRKLNAANRAAAVSYWLRQNSR